jgi:hypothetical protein
LNDRVEASDAPQYGYSLRLIHVHDLKIKISAEGARYGEMKRKVRGLFTCNGEMYHLMITDPLVERRYLGGPDGMHDVGSAILCLSLGDVFAGSAYKLIAAVLFPKKKAFAPR